MRRKELILQSPLRILDRWIRGGLGKGRLGVIVASAGVGKSACLVHLGLDALLRDRPVLHVALGQSVEHVSARYDATFDDLAERFGLVDRGAVRESIAHRRLIWAVAENAFSARGFDDALAAFQSHLGLEPAIVLIDGFEWEGPQSAATAAAVKASAGRAGAELWMAARQARGAGGLREPDAVALPYGCDAVVDVALLLSPRGRHARMRLVKDLEPRRAADLPLVLEGGALRMLTEDEASSEELDPRSFTLVATSSAGAEEAFGACAEEWGLHEVNFTFGGRPEVVRTRGLVELGEDDLKLGDVSAAYVRAHLHRTFPDPAVHGRVLQLIWHQVSTAGEVFFVGSINADDTAQGGTGWAVELARLWRKPVHVFDQERKGWFRWDGREWAAEAPPGITRFRFAGTGTRSLADDGREAIRSLFQRSFGVPER